MSRYLLKRLALTVPTLLLIAITVFTLIRLVPGDAATMLLADAEHSASSSQAAAVLREKLGLNRPYHEAFLSWLGGLARGDLGTSLRTGDAVGPELLRRLPVTVELTVLALAIGLLGVPLGVLSAVKADSPADYLSRAVSTGANAIPNFWLGFLLILIPFQLWGYAPPVTYVTLLQDPLTNLRIMLVPALALGIGLSATTLRMTRTTLLEVLRQDFVRTAQAKGLAPPAVVRRHALRNALVPTVEIVISQFGRLLSGVVIVEVVFALPGMGRATADAVMQRDYTTLQGFVLYAAATVLVLNLLADLAYAWLDPRIRYG